jgi:hypothetical protein
MDPWKVRVLRLTAFVESDEGWAAAHQVQWEDLTSSKPEAKQSKGDEEQQEGPFPPGRLILQKQPRRVDVLYAGTGEDMEPATPVVTVGPFEPASEALRGVAAKLFDKVGRWCTRLALGTDFVRMAATVEEAYQALVEHIRTTPFKLKGGQDFVYQLNRPRKSRVVPDMQINRLTRWNASSWRPVRFQVGGGSSPMVLTGPAHIGAVVATDVNTVADRTEPLPANQLLALFEELRGLTAEIRDHGDIP